MCALPRFTQWSVSKNVSGGSPGGSDSKESTCNAGNPDLIPGLERFPGEENGCPLQYSGLENSMDRGVWQATVHGVTMSHTRLSEIHYKTGKGLQRRYIFLKSGCHLFLFLNEHF